jgi:hypothetical protein
MHSFWVFDDDIETELEIVPMLSKVGNLKKVILRETKQDLKLVF